MMMNDLKRILLKLSGEALAGDKDFGFDEATCLKVAEQVKQITDKGTQVAIVIGGGNFWRGRNSSKIIERTKSDQIGMLGTVMNCIYVSEIFRTLGMQTEVYTPFMCGAFTKLFSKDAAVADLNAGKVVFFAGGTGHPYFSTDTGTTLRAIEIEADAILLAKAVDGVYDSDPKTNPNAKKYDSVSIQQVVDERLQVVDLTATIMCMENKMPKSLDALEREYTTIRAGRANPHILDKLKVDYYGTPTPLQQVGNVTVPEARVLMIQPWESKLIKDIEKAILASDIGITPTNDGKSIRLVFPELTEERRKELAKDVKKKGDAAKTAVRNIRRDGNDAFKKSNKAKEISEDEYAELQEKLQKITDKYVAMVDKAVEAKTKEIMTV